jgi:hypothetical protein
VYGIDLEDYNRMFAEQNGVCAACGFPESRIEAKTKKPKNLAVDHCHTTGRVRGLLCHYCNSALGLLKDDPARVAGLLAYAQRQQEETAKGLEVVRKHNPNQKPKKVLPPPPTVAELKTRCAAFYGSHALWWESVQTKLFRRTIEDEQMTPEMCVIMGDHLDYRFRERSRERKLMERQSRIERRNRK